MSEKMRNILVVTHALRPESIEAAVTVIDALNEAGVRVVLPADDRVDLTRAFPHLHVHAVLGRHVAVADVDLAIVLGGDGTILRAAELVRQGTAPVLGINMGHVGFLAELERDDIDEAVGRAVAGDYEVEERMAMSVKVEDSEGAVVFETWALNEATVEKGSRERMLEILIGIDDKPFTSFGCDGVVIATPTGSTAYNFSAGGPVVWPQVQAFTLVPLSAHALFARPLVLAPDSTVTVDVLHRNHGRGILWCDGRRSHDLPPGARVVARRSSRPVRLARLSQSDFTDRIVKKFHLPVLGWRGPDVIPPSESLPIVEV